MQIRTINAELAPQPASAYSQAAQSKTQWKCGKLVDLHLRKGLPAQTKYNGAQRIAYTSVIFMGAGMLLTGFAIYKPTSAHWLTSLLGGYEMARWLHFWLTWAFLGFFGVHVAQVILAGWNNFRSMVSGLEVQRVEVPSIEAERKSWR